MPIELKDATIASLQAGAAECYEASRWFREQFLQFGFPGDAPASVREAEVAAEVSAMQRQKLFAALSPMAKEE